MPSFSETDLTSAHCRSPWLLLDAVGATRYSYTSVGAVSAEDVPWDNDTVSYSYANQLRATLTLQRPSASPLNQTYSYDLAKRLTAIANAAGNYGYQYDPTHQLSVTRLTFPNGAYISNSFDAMAQMTGTFLKNSSHSILNSHQYIYDANDYRQVTRQTRTDGSYIDYGYDGIGQLTSALGKESGGTTNRLNEQLRYSYDKAGNLRSRTNNLFEQWFNLDITDELASLGQSNQLTVIGTTSSAATNVTVNTSNAVRYADNTFASTNQPWSDGFNPFTAIAQDSLGRRDTNSISPFLYGLSAFEYDQNGNMTFDAVNKYFEYDDENQLTAVYSSSSPPTWRSEFTYDGKMRRRIRKEYTWQGAWVLTNEVHYVYDGNLVIQERDALNAPVVTYVRGKDLGGSLETAGGIGGLLARTDERAGTTAFYHADRLGNVTMLINALQVPVAKYLYDPFGNTLSASGPLADANLYRFSSKELHPASGLTYFLYRYYATREQRWPNRDPLTEQGHRLRRGACKTCYAALRKEVNSYQFCENSPTVKYDPLGLLTQDDCDDAYDADMKKVRAAGLKCTGSAVKWAIWGEVIFGGGGIVIGGVVGAGAGGVGALPGAGIGLVVGTGVDVIVDTCHYLHCKHKVDKMKEAADKAHKDCLKKVDQ